jgi:hypothetical protein
MMHQLLNRTEPLKNSDSPVSTTRRGRIASRVVRVVGIGLSVLTIAVGAGITTTGTAEAKPQTIGAATVNCGIASCSLYVSRSATKEMHERAEILKAGGGGASTTACGALAYATLPVAWVTGPACLGVMAVHGAWVLNTIQDAATRHGEDGACFKVTRSAVGTLYFSTNNGTHCKD